VGFVRRAGNFLAKTGEKQWSAYLSIQLKKLSLRTRLRRVKQSPPETRGLLRSLHSLAMTGTMKGYLLFLMQNAKKTVLL
jgi:HEPN domain-containing protein